MIYRKLLTFTLLVLYTSVAAQMQEGVNVGSSDNLKLSAIAEIGFLGVMDHKIQFSNSGTYFDYKNEGGQDVLFSVSRFSLELKFKERNTLVFCTNPCAWKLKFYCKTI